MSYTELSLEDLYLQMQDDLYDGVKGEIPVQVYDALARGQTPQEILDATYELLNRRRGTWTQLSTGQELVAKFWFYYYQLNPKPIQSHVKSQEPLIGSNFLQDNLHWTM